MDWGWGWGWCSMVLGASTTFLRMIGWGMASLWGDTGSLIIILEWTAMGSKCSGLTPKTGLGVDSGLTCTMGGGKMMRELSWATSSREPSGEMILIGMGLRS